MKSEEKKPGIHSCGCRALNTHPAPTFPPCCHGLDHRHESPVSGTFCLFFQVLHGLGQRFLAAERVYATITMFFANSGNAREYTEAHQHKRHLLSTRKPPAFWQLNKWSPFLSLNIRQIEEDRIAVLAAYRWEIREKNCLLNSGHSKVPISHSLTCFYQWFLTSGDTRRPGHVYISNHSSAITSFGPQSKSDIIRICFIRWSPISCHLLMAFVSSLVIFVYTHSHIQFITNSWPRLIFCL